VSSKRSAATVGRDRVALVLALSLGFAVFTVTFAVLYDAIFSKGPGLSDNATTLLTTAFGGIIGVLGSYVGYRAGQASVMGDEPLPEEVEAPPDDSPGA
jgi:ABC-type uncharacterized transport system permease subunit